MAKGFFSKFARLPAGEAPMPPAEQGLPRPEEPAVELTEIVRDIARRGLPPLPRKAAISLRLDADVLDWFKAQGGGYQTRINAVLRAYMEAAR
jgi:uncharacterized protein (DUF4415 family)